MKTIPVTSSSEAASPDRRRQGAPAATVRTETAGTVRQKAVDAQSPHSETILNLPRPDLNEAQRSPGPEKMETIPVTSSDETHRTESQSSSQKASKQTSPDQRQQGSPATTVRTETIGPVRQKVADVLPHPSETVLSQSFQDSGKVQRRPGTETMESIPVTSSDETHRTESQSTTQKASKQTPPNRRQPGSTAVTVRTETAGTVRRKAVDVTSPPSETILNLPRPDPGEVRRRPSLENMKTTTVVTSNEMASPDQRQQGSPATTVRTETIGPVRQKVADVLPHPSETVLSQSFQDSGKVQRRPGTETMESIPVTSSDETHRTESQSTTQKASKQTPPNRRQPLGPPLPDPEKTQRRPGPENANNRAVTASNKTQNVVLIHQSAVKADLGKTSSSATFQTLAEDHPFSRNTQLQSDPVSDTSPKVGIDDRKRTVSSQGSTEKGLLPAHSSRSSRAAVIAHPEATRFVELTKQTTPQPAETNPTIQVTIGRVEVRAAAPPSPPAPTLPPPRSASPPAQKLSLDDYLKLRNGG